MLSGLSTPLLMRHIDLSVHTYTRHSMDIRSHSRDTGLHWQHIGRLRRGKGYAWGISWKHCLKYIECITMRSACKSHLDSGWRRLSLGSSYNHKEVGIVQLFPHIFHCRMGHRKVDLLVKRMSRSIELLQMCMDWVGNFPMMPHIDHWNTYEGITRDTLARNTHLGFAPLN